jgi:GNAT superfamily N-acetyltransferase
MKRQHAKPPTVELCSERHAELDSFLAERLYEFNSRMTGLFDGELLAGSVADSSGAVIAGVSGHTWGGCCELKQLWVHEAHRSLGFGTALMHAVEAEAQRRGCTQVVLTTHDFQAPAFYERLGYRQQGHDHWLPQRPFQHRLRQAARIATRTERDLDDPLQSRGAQVNAIADPAPGPVAAGEHATPEPGCFTCSMGHECPGYRNSHRRGGTAMHPPSTGYPKIRGVANS